MFAQPLIACPGLLLNLRSVNGAIPVHGNRHVNDLLDRLVRNALLWLEDWDVDDLFLHLRHGHIHYLLNLMVMVAILLLYDRHMRMKLAAHRHVDLHKGESVPDVPMIIVSLGKTHSAWRQRLPG